MSLWKKKWPGKTQQGERGEKDNLFGNAGCCLWRVGSHWSKIHYWNGISVCPIRQQDLWFGIISNDLKPVRLNASLLWGKAARSLWDAIINHLQQNRGIRACWTLSSLVGLELLWSCLSRVNFKGPEGRMVLLIPRLDHHRPKTWPQIATAIVSNFLSFSKHLRAYYFFECLHQNCELVIIFILQKTEFRPKLVKWPQSYFQAMLWYNKDLKPGLSSCQKKKKVPYWMWICETPQGKTNLSRQAGSPLKPWSSSVMPLAGDLFSQKYFLMILKIWEAVVWDSM